MTEYGEFQRRQRQAEANKKRLAAIGWRYDYRYNPPLHEFFIYDETGQLRSSAKTFHSAFWDVRNEVAQREQERAVQARLTRWQVASKGGER